MTAPNETTSVESYRPAFRTQRVFMPRELQESAKAAVADHGRDAQTQAITWLTFWLDLGESTVVVSDTPIPGPFYRGNLDAFYVLPDECKNYEATCAAMASARVLARRTFSSNSAARDGMDRAAGHLQAWVDLGATQKDLRDLVHKWNDGGRITPPREPPKVIETTIRVPRPATTREEPGPYDQNLPDLSPNPSGEQLAIVVAAAVGVVVLLGIMLSMLR
jgi:hypothetical protein